MALETPGTYVSMSPKHVTQILSRVHRTLIEDSYTVFISLATGANMVRNIGFGITYGFNASF